MKIEDILAPIDFSPGSLRALDYALAMVDPGGEVYLLHVIDADFLARVSDEGFCGAETARAQISLIVMGIRGRHQGGIEEILFGSTAEKVLRAARIPIVCAPPETNGGARQ